jgi:hypothetical protein
LLAYFGAPTSPWYINSSIDAAPGPACATADDCTGAWSLTAPSQSQFATHLGTVPEPGTFSLLGLGLLGVFGMGVRRFV